MVKKSILCTICTRKGSKGLKNKNILPIKGLPMFVFVAKIAEGNFHKKEETGILDVNLYNQRIYHCLKLESLSFKENYICIYGRYKVILHILILQYFLRTLYSISSK